MKIRHHTFDAVGSPALLEQRLREAERGGARAVLVLAGDGVAWPAEQVSPVLQALTLPVFGGVFPEVVHGVQHSATGLVVVALDNRAQVSVVHGLDRAGEDYGRALGPLTDELATAVVLVDGLAPFIARFVEAVFDHVGGGPSFIGGGAGSLSFQSRPCLFTPQGLLANAGLVVTLDTPVSIGVDHGWQAIAGPHLVTGTQGNTVNQLDYRPAGSVYRQVVEPLAGEALTEQNFFQHAKGFPFGIERFDGSLLVRDPIVMRGEDLVCVGEVPDQTLVRILQGQPEALIAAAARGTQSALKALPGSQLGGGLLIDCISRVLFLGDRFGEELAAVQSGLQAADPRARPLIGALTLGEIANNGSQCLEFYNKTLVLGAYAAG